MCNRRFIRPPALIATCKLVRTEASKHYWILNTFQWTQLIPEDYGTGTLQRWLLESVNKTEVRTMQLIIVVTDDPIVMQPLLDRQFARIGAVFRCVEANAEITQGVLDRQPHERAQHHQRYCAHLRRAR